MHLPVNEIPLPVPITGTLNETDEMVIALTSTHVYSSSVRFEIDVFKRRPTVSLGTHGFGRPETGRSSPYLLGFAWSDGSISSNMPMQNAGGLSGSGNSGGLQHVRSVFHLDHLPTPGRFAVITAWPFFDIVEQRVEFDASVITDAAARVRPLWEVVEIPPTGIDLPRIPPEDSVLVMPRTGWFGEHFDPSPPPPRTDAAGNPLEYHMFTNDADGNEIPLRPPPPGWRLAEAGE